MPVKTDGGGRPGRIPEWRNATTPSRWAYQVGAGRPREDDEDEDRE